VKKNQIVAHINGDFLPGIYYSVTLKSVQTLKEGHWGFIGERIIGDRNLANVLDLARMRPEIGQD